MKSKRFIALIAVVLATISLAALGVEEHISKGPMRFLLKSPGGLIAELRIRAGAECKFMASSASSQVEYDEQAGTVKARGGVILKIVSGTNSITVTADEIEGGPDAN
jgi:hypothetical protein